MSKLLSPTAWPGRKRGQSNWRRGRLAPTHCLKYEADEKRIIGAEDQAWDRWPGKEIWWESDGVLKHLSTEPDKKIFDWLIVESW